MKMVKSILLVSAMAVAANAIKVPPPDGDSCWRNTFAIVQNEIGVATGLNPALSIEDERQYVFCDDMIYHIGAIDQATGTFPNATAGEQWPLFFFMPNVHFLCPSTRNCVLELVDSPAPAVFSLISAQVIGSGFLPPNTTVPPSDISNFTIDGFVIRNANGFFEDTNGALTLAPPGQNILIRNCLFESVGVAGWAIASEYYTSEAELHSPEAIDPYYQTVTIQDCEFQMSAFDRSAIVSFAVDEPPQALVTEDGTMTVPTTSVLTLERLLFVGNNVTYNSTGSVEAGTYTALLSFEEYVSVPMATDLCFIDNGSPTGVLMELRNSDSSSSTLSGIFAQGNFAVDVEGPCSDGIILDDGTCVEADASSCSLLPDGETTAPMIDTTMTPTSYPSAAPTVAPTHLISAATADTYYFLSLSVALVCTWLSL